MAEVRIAAHWLVCVVWLWCGCGRDAIRSATECDALSPGDLVITEIHANPDGADGDAEYVELFNATRVDVALLGLELEAGRNDGSSRESHRFDAGSIAAGAYYVVGNASLEQSPPHLDQSYGGSLGALRNSAAALAIRCGNVLLDEVHYESTTDGRALELDGRLSPDHQLNDDPAHWCTTPEGSAPGFGSNFGTPGEPNSRCDAEPEVVEGLCLELGSLRAIRSPAAGAVAITEWMADPTGDDSALEWVEARFDADADLNAVELGPSADALGAVFQGQDCVPVGAGDHVVFGASPAAAPRVDAALPFSLGNSGQKSIALGSGSAVLDEVQYDGTAMGVSWQLDASGSFCFAEAAGEYAPGNLGTPGQPNPSCPLLVQPGTCVDGSETRDIVNPEVGDAFISEWMANPAAVDNRSGEWVELRFEAAVDLNGLELLDAAAGVTAIDARDCLSVEPGARVVLARSADPAENGGIDDVVSDLSISLNNSGDTLVLRHQGVVLDSVTWETASRGVATQIDSNGVVCDAVDAYGDGDFGTPGVANPVCA